jgi:hypothetical protein
MKKSIAKIKPAEIKYGYNPRLGDPVIRLPCEKKSHLTKA